MPGDGCLRHIVHLRRPHLVTWHLPIVAALAATSALCAPARFEARVVAVDKAEFCERVVALLKAKPQSPCGLSLPDTGFDDFKLLDWKEVDPKANRALLVAAAGARLTGGGNRYVRGPLEESSVEPLLKQELPKIDKAIASEKLRVATGRADGLVAFWTSPVTNARGPTI